MPSIESGKNFRSATVTDRRLRASIARLGATAAFALAMALSGLLGALATAQAQTPPASYYGLAAPNDRVEARFNGTRCAEATAGADGFWSLKVSAGGVCGVAEGGMLAFFRNGVDSGARETFHVAGVPASITNGVNVGSGPLQPPAPAVSSAVLLGDAPGPGGAALMVTLRAATPEAIRLALSAAGCQMRVIAVTSEGAWLVYIEGAPAAVNARFPATLADTTPFYVRC